MTGLCHPGLFKYMPGCLLNDTGNLVMAYLESIPISVCYMAICSVCSYERRKDRRQRALGTPSFQRKERKPELGHAYLCR